MTNPAVRLENITKAFSGVKALDGVTLEAQSGECLGLVGENGAGKSTLMKVLSGVWPSSSFEGSIFLGGHRQKFSLPKDATEAGIRIIHQELSLFDELSIAENLFMGDLPTKAFNVLDQESLYRRSQTILDQMKITLCPGLLLKELSVGQKQLIEIARAFTKPVKVLIFDEPTAALTDQECETLFELIHELKRNGVCCLYISHKLNEIRALCEKATILRDGQVVTTLLKHQMSDDQMVSAMVGRQIDSLYPIKPSLPQTRPVLFEVKNLFVHDSHDKPILKNISFQVKKGEILGIAGLVGSKRTELLLSLFGGLKENIKSGEFFLDGEKIKINNPRDAIGSKIALVTEDRKATGLILERSICENISISVLPRISFLSKIKIKEESHLADQYMKALRVKAPHKNFPVKFLSGGNQQKVILGRWLATQPQLLLLDEPTRGVDVGAKVEIYQILRDLVDQEGLTLIMVSSELPEVVSLSDRVLVMREGEIVDELQGKSVGSENIMERAVGS